MTDANSQAATRIFGLVIHGQLNVSTTSLSAATVSTGYSKTLQAGGGTLPYTWSVLNGSLPTGLSLDAVQGKITGTPTTVNQNPPAFTIQVRDSAGATATQALSLAVAALPTIATPSLSPGSLGQSYTQTLTESGGASPLTWSVPPGALPPGLVLGTPSGSSVALSGTPTATGTFTFTITVTDANSAVAQQTFTMVIDSPLTVTTMVLPGGTSGAPYSSAIAASGGRTPYTWSITSGLLPPGLSLAPGSGAISGTPQGTLTANFTVTVTDARGLTASQPLSITVSAIFAVQAARGYVYAGQQDTITANQAATWTISGIGSIAPATLSSTTTFTAPAAIASAQSTRITATAGTATAWLDETLLPAAPTLNPASGSYPAGQPVGFTMAGNHADYWNTTNDYLAMNFTPGVNWQWSSSCVAEYQPATQTLFLLADDGIAWSSAAITAATTLSNGICTISLPGAATLSGPNLAVRVNVKFQLAATGSRTSWIGDLVNVGTSYAYAQGTITITSPGSVSITPGTASVAFGGSQQFTATVTGMSNTAVNWSLSPAIGAISTTGLYTAPVPMSDQRSVTITATSQANGAVQGSATVTLVLPAILHLTSANLPVGTQYGATSSITADSGFVVGSGQTATLTSGGTITLGPGFHASAGSLFRATINAGVH